MIQDGSGAGTGEARPPTLEEVAARAGVSRATVSRVVNGNDRVRAEAREAVEAAIEELGYVPNPAARSLVTRRTDAIALVAAAGGQTFFEQPFFGGLVTAVDTRLAEAGKQLVLLMPSDDDSIQRARSYVIGGHVDGVLLTSLPEDDRLVDQLLVRTIPFVFCEHAERDDVTSVSADNVGGARLAVEHLLGRGRSRIATITGDAAQPYGRDRLRGYRDALARAGVASDDALVAEGDFSADSARAAVARLVASGADFDGLFAASDVMALAAIEELRAQGRRVPEDVAVVGFDDLPIAEAGDLTTVRQPVDEIGRLIAERLLDQLDGETRPRAETVDTSITVRGTS